MLDRLQAAAATLEAMGWAFDGKVWQPPHDRGYTFLRVIDDMAAMLQEDLDKALEHAEDDVGCEFVVNRLGPVLYAWNKVKPTRQDTEDGTHA